MATKIDSSLLKAVQQHSYKKARDLLSKGVSLFEQDKDGNTPLHLSIKQLSEPGNSKHGKAIQHTIEVLLNNMRSNNASVLLEIINNDGDTCLHLNLKGSGAQTKKVFELLLKHGANPLLLDANENTALHLAIITNKPADFARKIIRAGGYNAHENKDGKAPISLLVGPEHAELRMQVMMARMDNLEHGMKMIRTYNDYRQTKDESYERIFGTAPPAATNTVSTDNKTKNHDTLAVGERDKHYVRPKSHNH